MDLLQASPFLGIMPRPVVKDVDNEEARTLKVEEKVKKMEEQYSSLVLTQIEKTGTPEVSGIFIVFESCVVILLYQSCYMLVKPIPELLFYFCCLSESVLLVTAYIPHSDNRALILGHPDIYLVFGIIINHHLFNLSHTKIIHFFSRNHNISNSKDDEKVATKVSSYLCRSCLQNNTLRTQHEKFGDTRP
jgi:hypothetical protein